MPAIPERDGLLNHGRDAGGPAEDNPRGHFEPQAIVALNDAILAERGSSWLRIGPVDLPPADDAMLSRMDAAAVGANEQVLFHPLKAGRVVRSGNEVAGDVIVFHETIGVEGDRHAIEPKPWREAVGDARDDAVEITEKGAKAVGEFGVRTFEGAKTGAEKVVGTISDRFRGRGAASDDKTRDGE